MNRHRDNQPMVLMPNVARPNNFYFRIGEPITDLTTKGAVINYLFRVVPLHELKYIIITDETQVEILKKTQHYVSYNYIGTNCLLLFIQLNNEYKAIIIDRRSLKYNPSSIQLDKVNMYQISVRAHVNVYLGTIFDGILIQNSIFMVTDAYYLQGKNVFNNDELKNKIIQIGAFIEKNIVSSKVKFYLNEIHTYHDLKKLINKKEMTKLKFRVRGLVFYPKKSGTKYIYMFQNDPSFGGVNREQVLCRSAPCDNTETETKREEITPLIRPYNPVIAEEKEEKDVKFVKPVYKKNYITDDANKLSSIMRDQAESKQVIFAYFLVKKTGAPDVYELYLFSKKYNELRKKGTALIQTIEKSKFCKKLFQNETELIMKCQYEPRFNSWVPIKVSRRHKEPDSTKGVREKLS